MDDRTTIINSSTNGVCGGVYNAADIVHIKNINGLEYTVDHLLCTTCEFLSPCRLCTWVSRDQMDWIYDEDIEALLPEDRKWHVKNRRKMLRGMGIKENKGRGKSSKNYAKKDNEGRKGSNVSSVDNNDSNVMVI